MVNLEWFRTFKAIYDTGTLTAAAEKLFISQPGVSLHLNSLEAYIGAVLFDRGTRKMIPTEQGKILYNSIVEAIDKLENVEKYFHRKCDKERMTINMGMCFETFQHVLEPHISKFDFNLVSKFGNYPEMLNELDKGLLDFVITPQREDLQNISYTPFSKEKIVLIAGSNNKTDDFPSPEEPHFSKKTEEWLHQQKWFGTTGDMEHLRNFWLHNFGKRANVKINYIVPNLTSIVRCLSHNEGVAVVPDFLCREALQNQSIRIVWEGISPLENILYFAQRKKTMYKSEIETLKEIFNKKMNS